MIYAVMSSTGSKRILIRAAGTVLTPFGVSGVLLIPSLEFYDSSKVIATNGKWTSIAADGATIETVAPDVWSRGTKDAAILITLYPRINSALAKDSSGLAGNALIEVHEAP